MLAPRVISAFPDLEALLIDDSQYNSLLRQAQRIRGQVYVQDGAIRPWQLTKDGRLAHRLDLRSWHLLVLNRKGRVSGCIRYSDQPHDVDFSKLAVADSALAHSAEWGDHFRQAVESKREYARRHGLGYGEVGGWALVDELRYSRESMRITLAIYSLMRWLGGALALATATVRHNSSAILRKLGGKSLTDGSMDLPTYYDPHYECVMEVLTFDSRCPNPKYEEWIQTCQESLPTITAVCASAETRIAVPAEAQYALTATHHR